MITQNLIPAVTITIMIIFHTYTYLGILTYGLVIQFRRLKCPQFTRDDQALAN